MSMMVKNRETPPEKSIRIEIYVHKKRFLDSNTFLRSLEETVIFDLDGGIIEDIFKQKYHLELYHCPQYKGGDILKYKKQISYRLDLEAGIAFSILLDRMGKFLTFIDARDDLIPPPKKYEARKKVLNSESVGQIEEKLFQKLIDRLDMNTIRKMFESKYNLSLQSSLDYKKGNIVLHNKKVAYKFVFDSKVSFSLLIDRMGNYLIVTTKDELSDIKKLHKILHKKQKIHSPTNLIKIGDRRKSRRFLARKNTLVSVQPRPLLIGKIIDISAEGLSFIYFGHRRKFDRSSELRIFMAGLRKVISPERLPFKVILDRPPAQKIFPQNLLKIRKCGVQFGSLTNSQKAKLGYFIKNHTAGKLK